MTLAHIRHPCQTQINAKVQDIPHFPEQDEELAFKDRGYPNSFGEVQEFLTG
jgi:hypothetical protein